MGVCFQGLGDLGSPLSLPSPALPSSSQAVPSLGSHPTPQLQMSWEPRAWQSSCFLCVSRLRAVLSANHGA